MGYQALLFCPDEKLSLVISQVFGELDFTVELVHEPFAAVKKLMAQHYDAIVVDHENEQNAALLLKSARNSNSNHSSLAIALVAGQAGIAKAYRIGANLVLTKPINVEQAKGTIRVARGLLRKTSEAAGAGAASAAVSAIPANPTPVSAAALSEPDRRSAPRITFASTRSEESESESSPSSDTWPAESPAAFSGAFPETSPAALAEDKPALDPPGAASHRTTTAAEAQLPGRPLSPGGFNAAIGGDTIESGVTRKAGNSDAGISHAASGSLSARNTASVSHAAPGSATAPATAQEVTVPARGVSRAVESQPAGPSRRYASSASSHESHLDSSFSSAAANDGAPFGGVSKNSGGMSDNKKMLIAAVIVLALAALGYLLYGVFVKPGTVGALRTVNLLQDSPRPVTAPNSESSPMAVASTSGPNLATASTPSPPATALPNAPSGQPLTVTGKIPVTRIALNGGATAADGAVPAPASEPEKPAFRPVPEKSNGRAVKSQNEVSAPQLPLTVASADQNNISGVMSSAPSTVPHLSVTTMKISQGVSEGLLIKRIEPKYPRAALQAHAQGAVEIEATINKEGFVTHPKVLRGDPILARAALDAVSQWRYKPYYLDGAPVEIQTQITIKFRPN
jgi:TonB family protein